MNPLSVSWTTVLLLLVSATIHLPTSCLAFATPTPAPTTMATTNHFILSLAHHLGRVNDPTADISLILASQSPRRREILDMMGLSHKHTPTPSPLDETLLQQQLLPQNNDNTNTNTITPIQYTQRLAEEKAKALALHLLVAATADDDGVTVPRRPTLILGSDTIVDLEGTILEKPIDTNDARRMLTLLSGRTHFVHTGVAVFRVDPNHNNTPSLVDSFTDTAQVTFATLSPADIDAYIATQEPMDKAGAYGIQGIGGQLVAQVQGDFFTVMGLPMHRTSLLLTRAVQNILLQGKSSSNE